jgi:hypothetical protein
MDLSPFFSSGTAKGRNGKVNPSTVAFAADVEGARISEKRPDMK